MIIQVIQTSDDPQVPDTVTDRWLRLGDWRIVILVVMLNLLEAVAIFVRPENPATNYLVELTDQTPSFIMFTYLLGVMALPLVYYLFRNLWSLVIGLIPYLITSSFLIAQVARSETAPLTHLVPRLMIILVLALSFLGVERAKLKDKVIAELVEQLKLAKQSSASEDSSEDHKDGG